MFYFRYDVFTSRNILNILFVIIPGEARSDLTHGASGKLGEKEGLRFVKVKDHQTDQALHFYKVEQWTTLSTPFKLPDEIPKL